MIKIQGTAKEEEKLGNIKEIKFSLKYIEDQKMKNKTFTIMKKKNRRR